MRALILTEDRLLLSSLTDMLKGNMIFDSVENYQDADYYFDIRNYDVFILDIANNIENLDFISSTYLYHQKMMILALGEQKYELEALRNGASDFISPPFNMEIILLRIQNFLKLHQAFDSCFIYHDSISGFIFDKDSISVSFKEKSVSLSEMEFNLFYMLLSHKGIVDSYQILDAIFEEPELVPDTGVSRLISSLRYKLNKTFEFNFIETVPRRGYRFTNIPLMEEEV